MEKEKIIERQQEIIRLAKSFCNEKLDEEYADLAEKLICKLGEEQNVPFVSGQTSIWAAAVIHALGSINFLFDESFEPYVSMDDIDNFFGTDGFRTSTESRRIRNLLNITYWDDEFSTKKLKYGDSDGNFVKVDDIMLPMSFLSEEQKEWVLLGRKYGSEFGFTTV